LLENSVAIRITQSFPYFVQSNEVDWQLLNYNSNKLKSKVDNIYKTKRKNTCSS